MLLEFGTGLSSEVHVPELWSSGSCCFEVVELLRCQASGESPNHWSHALGGPLGLKLLSCYSLGPRQTGFDIALNAHSVRSGSAQWPTSDFYFYYMVLYTLVTVRTQVEKMHKNWGLRNKILFIGNEYDSQDFYNKEPTTGKAPPDAVDPKLKMLMGPRVLWGFQRKEGRGSLQILVEGASVETEAGWELWR